MERERIINFSNEQITILDDKLKTDMLIGKLIKDIFLFQIRSQIKQAAQKIINKFTSFNYRLNTKKMALLDILKRNLNKSSILIQKHYRSFSTRIKFGSLLRHRQKNYFYIIIEFIRKKVIFIHLRIKLKEDDIVLKFEHCCIYNFYYVFVNKKFIESESISIKANFYIDGILQNNMKYSSEYDINGNFLNIIFFSHKQSYSMKYEPEDDLPKMRKKSSSTPFLENVKTEEIEKSNSSMINLFKSILKNNSPFGKTKEKRVSFIC